MKPWSVRPALLLLSVLVVGATVLAIHFPPAPLARRALALHLKVEEAPRASEVAPPQPASRKSIPAEGLTRPANRPRRTAATDSPARPQHSLPSPAAPDERLADESSKARLEREAAGEGTPDSGAEEEAAGAGSEATESRQAPSGEPEASPESMASALTAYRTEVYSLIAANKRYPDIARRLEHTGRVKIAFALGREGNLLAGSVKSESGFPELDEAALAAVRAVGRFPAFPTVIRQEKLDFEVSMVFELE